MSGLTAVSTALAAAGSVIGAAVTASQADRAAQLQVAAQNREYAMRARQMKLQHEIEERRRRQALKEALAARRARFGSAGIGAGGSAGALLAGLRRKSAKAGAEAAAEKRLGLQSGLLSLENSNRRALQNAAFASESAALSGSIGLGTNVVDGLKEDEWMRAARS